MSLIEQLTTKAAQCRAWAKEMHEDVERSQLLAMAKQYDRLIRQIPPLDEQEARDWHHFSARLVLDAATRAGEPIGPGRVMNGRRSAAA